ncbi:MAG: sensor histidine kinase [Chitinophagaceae bacterium]
MVRSENLNRFLFTLFGFEKAGRKAHILLVVLIHIMGWCLLFILPAFIYPVRINDSWFLTRELVDKLVLVILFYLNYYLLIPRFFEKKRYIRYTSFVLLAFLVYLFQHVLIKDRFFPGTRIFSQSFGSAARPAFPFHPDSIPLPSGNASVHIVNDIAFETDSLRKRVGFIRSSGMPDGKGNVMTIFRGPEPGLFGIPRGIWAMSLKNAISSFALLLLIGGFIRLAHSFIRNLNEKKALENANLNAEVNFLKSQINPHFLFNTLNSIYAQAHSKSDNTEFSILKLSELLRYSLYDSGEDMVPLSKDIEYINNYIALQRLRLSDRISLHYKVNGDTNGVIIAPLLLISFIENAFKHGISYTQPSSIRIDISIFETTLTLCVTNPILEKDSFVPGGLGLKNVKRRLELLYPDHHQLDIRRDNGLHIVNLKLELAHA